MQAIVPNNSVWRPSLRARGTQRHGMYVHRECGVRRLSQRSREIRQHFGKPKPNLSLRRRRRRFDLSVTFHCTPWAASRELSKCEYPAVSTESLP